MRCTVCGSVRAFVRAEQIAVARISGKAHVQCGGHAAYRYVTTEEINESEAHAAAGGDPDNRPAWWVDSREASDA